MLSLGYHLENQVVIPLGLFSFDVLEDSAWSNLMTIEVFSSPKLTDVDI